MLECYVSRRDEAAFEALVRRHGPMVLGVCRRILRNEADAYLRGRVLTCQDKHPEALQAFAEAEEPARRAYQASLIPSWLGKPEC